LLFLDDLKPMLWAPILTLVTEVDDHVWVYFANACRQIGRRVNAKTAMPSHVPSSSYPMLFLLVLEAPSLAEAGTPAAACPRAAGARAAQYATNVRFRTLGGLCVGRLPAAGHTVGARAGERG
jgi:hypothetical protein